MLHDDDELTNKLLPVIWQQRGCIYCA